MPYPAAFTVLMMFTLAQATPTPKEVDRVAKWEKNVAAIEKRLKDKSPPAEPVVFAGSSTVVRWDLAKSFPGKPTVNVGFGGSQIPDNVIFAPRLVVPLKPKTVVFYAGDNDIAGKRTPEQVRDDFKAFVAAVPDTKILFVSIKPSVSRWKQFDQQTKANALLKEFCASNSRLGYIDIVPTLLGPDGGMPPADLFVTDGLHLSEKGYEKVNAVVAKALGW